MVVSCVYIITVMSLCISLMQLHYSPPAFSFYTDHLCLIRGFLIAPSSFNCCVFCFLWPTDWIVIISSPKPFLLVYGLLLLFWPFKELIVWVIVLHRGKRERERIFLFQFQKRHLHGWKKPDGLVSLRVCSLFSLLYFLGYRDHAMMMIIFES